MCLHPFSSLLILGLVSNSKSKVSVSSRFQATKCVGFSQCVGLGLVRVSHLWVRYRTLREYDYELTSLEIVGAKYTYGPHCDMQKRATIMIQGMENFKYPERLRQ